MDNRLTKIRKGFYVALKNGFDIPEFYRGVSAGATGWVKQTKMDEYGFPMLYIEWDQRNHNWSGEPDKWTFESHFRTLNDGTDIDADAYYIDSLREASDAALAGTGYIMIVVNERPSENKNGISITTYGSFLDPMAKEFAEQHIIDMADAIVSNDLEDEDYESGR